MSCRSLYVLATLFTSTLGVIPVHAQSTSFDVENGQYNNCTAATNNYSYCLNLPPKYGEKHSWPLMVFLGGSGTKGDASEAKYLATYESLGKELAQTLSGNPSDAGEAIRDNFVTAVVVAPKSDFVYDPQAVSDIVSANLAKFNKISPHQVYLTGYSMGCRGALRTLITYPNLFSAAICSAGYAEQAGDHYLELDGNAQPTYPILDHAAGVPIAFGYSPDDATNLANNTIATIKELDAAGASCNTVCVPSAQSNDDRTLNLYAAKLFLVSLIVIWDWL